MTSYPIFTHAALPYRASDLYGSPTVDLLDFDEDSVSENREVRACRCCPGHRHNEKIIAGAQLMGFGGHSDFMNAAALTDLYIYLLDELGYRMTGEMTDLGDYQLVAIERG